MTHSYSASATMKAIRVIFEQNQDKSFEARWALAKSSDAYRGFQIRCGTSAKVLIVFVVPAMLFWLTVGRGAVGDGEASVSTIVVAALYVAISIAVSWKLGIKAAKAKMAVARSGE